MQPFFPLISGLKFLCIRMLRDQGRPHAWELEYGLILLQKQKTIVFHMQIKLTKNPPTKN
jgi:hypothetical protein